MKDGYNVKVYDLFLYGDDVFNAIEDRSELALIRGDIRNTKFLANHLRGCDIIIHLACISNDPSFELNPSLGKSINYDAFEPMVKAAIDSGVERFIYASSSSVYGIKEEQNVTEELSLEPLTDYSKYKALCEDILQKYTSQNFYTTIIRPATVCGYSPRLRLDLIVNILTNHAYHNRKIKILGGNQYRPNIHIEDMTNCYLKILNFPKEEINGEIFNVGEKNYTVNEIAKMVRDAIGNDVVLETESSNDERSYRVSSEKIKKIINFSTEFTIKDAVSDLKKAFVEKKTLNPLINDRYYNIKLMQRINLV